MSDRVDRWLEQALPPTEEDSGRQDVQLAILKEKLRTRRRARKNRRLRGGMVVVSLAVLGVLFGGVVDLGGDSFELEEYEGENAAERGLKIYRNEFRGGGLGVQEDMSEAEVQELNQQMAAGEGLIVAIMGLSIDGKTDWAIRIQREVLGEKRLQGEPPRDTPSQGTRAHLEFFDAEHTQLESEIESGLRRPTGRQIMEFDGVSYDVEFWVIESEKFGEVIYYKGVPIR